MALSADGKEGWAIGAEGLVVHYVGNEWKVDERASPLGKDDLISIWLSADGKAGWIVGQRGAVLQLRAGIWRRMKSASQETLKSVSSDGDGAHACAVSDLLNLWCFESGSFTRSAQPPNFLDEDLLGPSIAWSNREPAWAFIAAETATTRVHLFAVRYEQGQWKAPVSIGSADDDNSEDSRSPVHSVWLASDQSKGWAVGSNGLLLKLEEGQWSSSPQSETLTHETLLSVNFTPDGSHGWALGNRGTLLSWNGRQWQSASPPQMQKKTLFKIAWLTADGPRAWALTGDGTIALILQGSSWTALPGPETLTGAELLQVGCEIPSSAWILGLLEDSRRIILRLTEQGWKIDKLVPRPEGDPDAGLSIDGTSGWAISSVGGFLHWGGESWQPWLGMVPNPPIRGVKAIRLSANGDLGLVLAADGRLFLYRHGAWVEDHRARALLGGDVEKLWLSETDLSGWVSTNSNRLLRFYSGEWAPHADSLGSEQLRVVLPTAEGNDSLALDNGGQTFRFKDGAWLLDPNLTGLETVGGLYGLADYPFGWLVSPDRTLWARGKEGHLMHDVQAGSLVAGSLRSVCLAPDGKAGWAVGLHGTILRYSPKPISPAMLLSERGADLEELKGTYRLSFENELQPADVPKIRLIDQDRGGEGLALTPQEYDLQPVGPRKFRLEFKSAASRLVKAQAGVLQKLRVEARLAHPSLPVIAVFETRPIYLHGRPLWQKILSGAVAVLGGNLLLFLAAARVRWLRTMVLHPVGSAAIGLVVGKYLVTDWLIRFVLPLKLSMFRDYRRGLAQSSALATWTGRVYVPPQVSLEERPTAPPGPPGEEAWRFVFRELLRQPSRRVWLVLGPSGLGKTALLENWTRLALELGQTPFLIRLRNSLAPKEEAAALMGQFGDVNVTSDVAQDLLTGGGFVLLLDGYNEDRTPEVTREFVRQAAKRNLVIVTSQFDPDWRKILDVQRIHLDSFGRDQLRQILDEQWVDRVLASPHLAEIARLPFTAQLLARFIGRNQQLPHNELEIYDDLRTGLEAGPVLNLEATAWELFKGNETELSPGPRLPKEFCEAAVETGVLTRRVRDGKDSYRFVHERIHRLFVASYLDRQDAKPLADWHQEVIPGLGRGYWTDVLDFWGQIKGHLASHGGGGEMQAYLDFLRKVADFSQPIFAQRLYIQYDRLCRSCPGLVDQDFIAWAALFLAKAS